MRVCSRHGVPTRSEDSLCGAGFLLPFPGQWGSSQVVGAAGAVTAFLTEPSFQHHSPFLSLMYLLKEVSTLKYPVFTRFAQNALFSSLKFALNGALQCLLLSLICGLGFPDEPWC